MALLGDIATGGALLVAGVTAGGAGCLHNSLGIQNAFADMVIHVLLGHDVSKVDEGLLLALCVNAAGAGEVCLVTGFHTGSGLSLYRSPGMLAVLAGSVATAVLADIGLGIVIVALGRSGGLHGGVTDRAGLGQYAASGTGSGIHALVQSMNVAGAGHPQVSLQAGFIKEDGAVVALGVIGIHFHTVHIQDHLGGNVLVGQGHAICKGSYPVAICSV